MSSIEALLEEISERGWTVYQLCQAQAGDPNPWRAYLRTDEPEKVSYGEGTSAAEALTSAMETKIFETIPIIEIARTSTTSSADLQLRLRESLGLISRTYQEYLNAKNTHDL